MANYALIDTNNNVVNVIVWDGAASYTPPDGITLIQSDVAGPGMIYDPNTLTFSYPE